MANHPTYSNPIMSANTFAPPDTFSDASQDVEGRYCCFRQFSICLIACPQSQQSQNKETKPSRIEVAIRLAKSVFTPFPWIDVGSQLYYRIRPSLLDKMFWRALELKCKIPTRRTSRISWQ